MYKNYFILNRIILELNSALKSSVITEIFSQEKDKLVIKCEEEEVYFIEISVNPGQPYISLKKEYHRAKKNSLDFFEEFLPQEIKGFGISDHDRLVKVMCRDINLYFAVRGKHTNVFLEDDNKNFNFFKNVRDEYLEEFRNEIPLHKFISEKKEIVFTSPNLQFDEYRKKFPFLGKEIIAEAQFRYSENAKKNNSEYIREITSELLEEEPAVFNSKQDNNVYLSVKKFHIFPSNEIKLFDSIIGAINFYLGKQFYLESLSSKKKIIEKHIERELSRLSTKMNDLKGRIDRGSKEEEYNKIGNLLLINLSAIPEKSNFVELKDIYENDKIIKIKLDPKLAPRKNAEYYFNKSRNERKAYKKSKELFEDISNNFTRYLRIKGDFNKSESIEEMNTIMKELNIKQEVKNSPADIMKSKFKHYIIDKKYDVFVGKDSANNDLLTMKFAKQNDYWFHARSVPGSHIVLRVVNTKVPVPKNILKKAASIAAYHSKAKSSGLVPVSYTLKKYVTKKKGMEPGKVALLREDVFIVKPEIPLNCEYISTE
jgi:predicted ribosome quality control (RQC) complex YloA/Tae2 family protein